MRYPPGVVMCRNGASFATSPSASSSVGSSGSANPRSTAAPSPSGSVESSNKFRVILLRIVKNNTNRMAAARPHSAHAMAEIDSINAARPGDRPMMNREHNSTSLAKRYDLRARLHAWPLLRHDEFPALEILARLGQQNRDL